MKRITGRSAASARTVWTNTVWSESFVSGSAPPGATSPRRSDANAGTSNGVSRRRAASASSSPCGPKCSSSAVENARHAVAAPEGG